MIESGIVTSVWWDIRFYVGENGKAPFEVWLKELRDRRVRAIVLSRLQRIRGGNLGDVKPVGGGVMECRIAFGAGYRLYFGIDGKTIVLLGAGDKSSQSGDIARAQALWREYER